MMEAGAHAFALALICLTTALVLLIYKALNPERRSELVRLSISRATLCGVAFAVSGVAKVVEPESYRIQVLTLAPVNLAIILVVSGICTTQARSYGTVEISPKARALLRHSKRVFLLTFGVSIALSLLWPVPAQQDFDPAPAIYLLDRALVTFPEMVFPAVAAFVAFQAARSQEPVGRIRIQQASFFVSHLVLASIGFNTFSVVCYRVFVENDELRRELIERAHVLDGVIVTVISLAYVVGVFLYYVNDDRSRAITRFNWWRRMRQRWEQRLRQLDDKSVAEQYPQYANIKVAASELIERRSHEATGDGFGYEDVRKSQLAFKFLMLTSSPSSGIDREEDAELQRLVRYQESLLRDPSTREVSWSITGQPGKEVTFDLRTDPLLEIAKRTREFLHDSRNSSQLVDQPQWFQLAVLAAAKADILPPARAGRIINRKAVMDRVSRAYRNAGILGTMYGTAPITDETAIQECISDIHNI